MSTQRERLMASLSTSADGHAVKLNESEFTAPKQAEGLTLSPVRRLPRLEVVLSEKNQKAFSPLSEPDFERLKADIKERGIIVPLILKRDKTLIAGHNRLRAAEALGLESVPVQYVETELSPESETAFVIKDNLLRRQLTAEQKERLIADLYGEQIRQSQHGGARGNQHSKSAKVQVNLAKKIESETGIKAGTAKRIIADIKRSDSAKNPLSERTKSHQKGSAQQGRGADRGENKKALKAFNSGLESALSRIEGESAETLKIAVRHAKSWLKNLERKLRSALSEPINGKLNSGSGVGESKRQKTEREQ